MLADLRASYAFVLKPIKFYRTVETGSRRLIHTEHFFSGQVSAED